MKRSMQEVVELAVFALIALLVGTGLVWLSGWILSLAGTVLTWLAGLVWSLLRFLVPVAVVAGLVYLLVQFLTRSGQRVAGTPQEQPMTPPSPWSKPSASEKGEPFESGVETPPATGGVAKAGVEESTEEALDEEPAQEPAREQEQERDVEPESETEDDEPEDDAERRD